MKNKSLFLILSAIVLSGCSSSQPNKNDSLSSSPINSESSQQDSLSENKSTEENESSYIENDPSSVEESSYSSLEEEPPSQNLRWSSLEEAVIFYESTLIANKGEDIANIFLNGEFYERDSWEMEENSDNKIVLSLANTGRGGRDVMDLVKGEEYTTITFFDWRAHYPEQPTLRWTVRNSDFILIEEEDLNSDIAIDPFTAENAFVFLKEQESFNDDLILGHSSYNSEENFYELVVISQSLRNQGGSGTVGIYHVYEDGRIVDTYAE